MNIRLFQTILVLCFLLLAGGCANQPARYQVDMVSDLIMMFPGADHKDTHLELGHRMVEKDKQGNILVEVTIHSVKAAMGSLGIKLNYDSDRDEGPIKAREGDKQNRPEKYRLSFTGLQGTTYRALVNPKTGSVELMDLPKQLKPIASGQVSGPFGGDQISMVLSRACLEDYAALGYLEDLDQPWFHQGNTVVPGVASVKTQRAIGDEQKAADPNHPTFTKVSFTLTEATEPSNQTEPASAKPTRKQAGMQLSTFEGQGHILRHQGKGSILYWEENSTAHIHTSARKKARSGTKKKKKQIIYYMIKKTIQQVER